MYGFIKRQHYIKNMEIGNVCRGNWDATSTHVGAHSVACPPSSSSGVLLTLLQPHVEGSGCESSFSLLAGTSHELGHPPLRQFCFKEQNLPRNGYSVHFRLLQAHPPACTARVGLEFNWQKASGSCSGRAWEGSAVCLRRNLPDLVAEMDLGGFVCV